MPSESRNGYRSRLHLAAEEVREQELFDALDPPVGLPPSYYVERISSQVCIEEFEEIRDANWLSRGVPWFLDVVDYGRDVHSNMSVAQWVIRADTLVAAGGYAMFVDHTTDLLEPDGRTSIDDLDSSSVRLFFANVALYRCIGLSNRPFSPRHEEAERQSHWVKFEAFVLDFAKQLRALQ